MEESVLRRFFGSIEDLRSVIMSAPSRNSRFPDDVVAGIQCTLRVNFDNNGRFFWFAFQNT